MFVFFLKRFGNFGKIGMRFVFKEVVVLFGVGLFWNVRCFFLRRVRDVDGISCFTVNCIFRCFFIFSVSRINLVLFEFERGVVIKGFNDVIDFW